MSWNARSVGWGSAGGVCLIVGLIAAARFTGSVSDGTVAANLNAVAVFVSALAFGGFLFAVHLQREELFLQREELTATRTELEGQRLAMEGQVTLLRKQSFDSAFFALLNSHNTLAASLVAYPAGREMPEPGLRAFHWAVGAIESQVAERMRRGESLTGLLDAVAHTFSNACYSEIADFSHYFRTLEALTFYVLEHDKGDHGTYWTIIRSQFSMNQHRLIYYYALSGRASDKFVSLTVIARLFWGLIPTDQMKPFFSHHPWDLPPKVQA